MAKGLGLGLDNISSLILERGGLKAIGKFSNFFIEPLVSYVLLS